MKTVKGDFVCLTGNQVASMLGEYRLSAFKRKQLLKEGNASNFAILKTFVTTPLLDKIASHYGARCVNTLPASSGWPKKWQNMKIPALSR